MYFVLLFFLLLNMTRHTAEYVAICAYVARAGCWPDVTLGGGNAEGGSSSGGGSGGISKYSALVWLVA